MKNRAAFDCCSPVMVDKNETIGLFGLSEIKVHQDHEKGSKGYSQKKDFPIPEIFQHSFFEKRK
jgi:hypothetical protein